MQRFDDGVTDAIVKLKRKLPLSIGNEIDVCLQEAHERRDRNHLQRPAILSDNLITPANGNDPDEDMTLQGSLCAIIDRHNFNNLSVRFETQNDWFNVRRIRELNDLSTSHSWVACINPVHGPALSPAHFNTAIKLRIGCPFLNNPITCPKCRLKTMDKFAIHSLCCASAESTKGHYCVRDRTLELVHLADPSATAESRNLFPNAPALRPADIFTTAAFPGCATALDIGICCPEACSSGIDCCDSMYTSKTNKYEPYLQQAAIDGILYRPLIFVLLRPCSP